MRCLAKDFPAFFIKEAAYVKIKKATVPRCPYCGSVAILRSAEGIYRSHSAGKMLKRDRTADLLNSLGEAFLNSRNYSNKIAENQENEEGLI